MGHHHRRTPGAAEPRTGTMNLDDLLATVRDGDEHGWPAEFEYLRLNHGARIRALIGSVLRTGIRSPILIGSDGRIWDGHHRIYAAHVLGIRQIPVQYARP